jgi:N-acetylmuramoyl-L-alanine amidase
MNFFVIYFARSVNNQAWLAAYMLKQNGLTPSFADKNKGIGTIISHNAVRQYWGIIMIGH